MGLKQYAARHPVVAGKRCWMCQLDTKTRRECETGYAQGVPVTTITAYLREEGHHGVTDSRVRRHLKEHSGTR